MSPDPAQDAADALTAHGDDWPQHLPDGATITDRDEPAVHDTVRLADGTLVYRRTLEADPGAAAPYWVPVGWSDASKARRYRPTPADLRPWSADDHDPS